MKCSTCGTDNPAQARFCLNYGEKLLAICSHCQAKAPPQARFCPSCASTMQIGSAKEHP